MSEMRKIATIRAADLPPEFWQQLRSGGPTRRDLAALITSSAKRKAARYFRSIEPERPRPWWKLWGRA